jgi:hypothetical protein
MIFCPVFSKCTLVTFIIPAYVRFSSDSSPVTLVYALADPSLLQTYLMDAHSYLSSFLLAMHHNVCACTRLVGNWGIVGFTLRMVYRYDFYIVCMYMTYKAKICVCYLQKHFQLQGLRPMTPDQEQYLWIPLRASPDIPCSSLRRATPPP